MNRLSLPATALFLLSLITSPAGAQEEPSLTEGYLERYLETFPSTATATGDHRYDDQLEHLTPEKIDAWLHFNHETAKKLERRLSATSLGGASLGGDARLDAEVLLRQARREIFELETLRRHQTDPLFWTSTLSQTAVFLLVREDRPLEVRLRDLATRLYQVPRFVDEARASLAKGDPAEIAPERCSRAAGQARALASFFRDGLDEPASRLPPLEGRLEGLRGTRLTVAGKKAAAALEELAAFIDEVGEKASGSFRFGENYPEIFRLVTGVSDSVGTILKSAEAALVEKRAEAAEHCRTIWPTALGGSALPDDDKEVVRACFERIGRDRASSIEEFVADYRQLTAEAWAFVEEKGLMALPSPFVVEVDRSPSYFGGAAVGGIYPPGPFSPESASLLFVPTPPDNTPAEQLAGFFRDFNHHFNVMITPHETIPGHAAQMTLAAHGPSKVRALFADGVYVEGWGTFSERLMLDQGWGDGLAHAAHLKKQLENIARAIVDIRVHTRGMSRDEVLTFVREEALQDEQFAVNMWNRTLTTAPQITTYWLGYQQIWDLYGDYREAKGEAFEVREFVDGMMELGPVPLRHYRALLLPRHSERAYTGQGR